MIKFEDRNHTGRPPTNEDFFRVVPWKAFPDNRMGPNPTEWLLASINDEARIIVDDSFIFPEINSAVHTPTSVNKKRK